MIKVENIDVWGFRHAIRGMRNPMNSWEKSDSYQSGFTDDGKHGFVIGSHDLDLMKRLYKAGTEHRKYLRQIFVSMDIVAPLYWWKEFDTYKVGTVSNSCSTMHRITERRLTRDDFSDEGLMLVDEQDGERIERNLYDATLDEIIDRLNIAIGYYKRHGDKRYEGVIFKLLPSCYNQRRTITMNYENVVTIVKQRTGHKLDEWNQFVEVLKDLPYIADIMEEKEE